MWQQMLCKCGLLFMFVTQTGYNPGSVRQKLRVQMHFSHTNYSPKISALTRTISYHGEKSGDISGSIISTLRNLIRILIRILILLLGGLLVLLTIELLTNHGSGTGVQGMATAANITRSERKRY